MPAASFETRRLWTSLSFNMGDSLPFWPANLRTYSSKRFFNRFSSVAFMGAMFLFDRLLHFGKLFFPAEIVTPRIARIQQMKLAFLFIISAISVISGQIY